MAAPVCAHCSLPVPGVAAAAPSAVDAEPQYCCFGCRLAADAARESTADGEIGRTCLRLGLSIFLSLNVMIFTMWLWTHDVYGPTDTGVDAAAPAALWNLCRYACLVFSLPVLWMLGGPVAQGAVASLRRKVPTTDILLVLGTVAAYAYSIVSTLRGAGPVYFEIGCAVLVFVTLGRWLEARGKRAAAAALEALERLLPAEVRRYEGTETRAVPLDDVVVGDRLRVVAGERIPADGRIVRGIASIDAQMLSGESRPQVCEPGDPVFGGTLNLDGDLTIRVEAPPRGGAWQRIVDCMREARQAKGRYQLAADRAAAWFLPAVLVIAVGAFAYHATYSGLDQGVLAGLAVVLVACPCALGLATPLAVWAALGAAARAQVMFRHGEALERLAAGRGIAFDKTGTLTDGRPQIERVVFAPGVDEAALLGRALAAASAANHDLSRAVVEYGRARRTGVVPSCDVRTLAGRGLSATFADGEVVTLGSLRLMCESGLTLPAEIAAAADGDASAEAPRVFVGRRGRVAALFLFREQLRPAAQAVVERCRNEGMTVEVLTGDHARRGAALAARLQVPVRAELLPEDKVRAVCALRDRVGPTAMVGDGINDAPSLTAADVGIALGCGADVSRQSADVCLLGDDLSRIPWSIELARHTVRVIRQNLGWSFGYNVLGIALAASGRLNPIWAAAAMVAGGLYVVGNSLRLARFAPPDASTTSPPADAPAARPANDSVSGGVR